MPSTLSETVHSDLTIKKSRFIAMVQPVKDREQAKTVVAELWQQHPGAAHVCWALMAGGQSAAVDDGEPSGTAGRPMLELLRHQDLEGVLATVVRYFGGVKLGAGGLMRAYTDAVAQALLNAEKVPIVATKILSLAVPYSLEGHIRRQCENGAADLQEVLHGFDVRIKINVPASQVESLMDLWNEIGQGQLVWLDGCEKDAGP